MIKFRNEKGATLVLTLFIVTLMLLFVLTLFYQITNTTRQVTTMEKNIDARNVAEMGVEYYFQKIIYDHEQEPAEEIGEIITQLQSEIGKEITVDENRRFTLIRAEINGSNNITIICKGIAFGKAVIEQNEITLVEN